MVGSLPIVAIDEVARQKHVANIKTLTCRNMRGIHQDSNMSALRPCRQFEDVGSLSIGAIDK
jgi:hypothetical protein